MLETQVVPRWSSLVLRGIIAIIFGILAFWMPSLTLTALVILYGLYAAADGLVSLSELFSSSCPNARKSWIALMGVAGVGAAAVSFLWPAMTAMVLLFIIAFWAIVRGIFELATWWSSHKTVDDCWILRARRRSFRSRSASCFLRGPEQVRSPLRGLWRPTPSSSAWSSWPLGSR